MATYDHVEIFEIINPEPPRPEVGITPSPSYNPSHNKLALSNLRKKLASQMKANGKKKKEAQAIEWAFKTVAERFEHLVERRLDARTLFNHSFLLKYIKYAS